MCILVLSLFRKTMEALKSLKFNDFEKYFQEIMLKSTSNWDTSKEAFLSWIIVRYVKLFR